MNILDHNKPPKREYLNLPKIIYRTSISLICFWILVAILGPFIPIEFTDSKITDTYYMIRFWGVPIAVLLTLFGTINPDESFESIGINILCTCFLSGLSAFCMFMAMFLGMCSWTTGDLLFENKQNRSIKIVERSFGCGATDSGSPTRKIFKVKELTNYLNWVTEIDTATLDRRDWERMN